MNRSPTEWLEVLCGCGVRVSDATMWAPVFSEVLTDTTFNTGPNELAYFLGQVLHESSNLQHLEESLNYSTAARLCAVWPKRFPNEDAAKPYIHQPEKLANFVYGGRMGNKNPGDGWKYRGSGLIQVTGADNFRAVQDATGIPVFDHPELLRQPSAESLRATVAWWEGHIPDQCIGSVERITKLVNGGTIGIEERKHLTDRALYVLSHS